MGQRTGRHTASTRRRVLPRAGFAWPTLKSLSPQLISLRAALSMRHVALPLAIVMGMMASGVLVWRGTAAVFTATTATGANSWTVGSVALSDDDSGGALFTASGLVPGSTNANCITVSYTGTVSASIKLYATAATDASSVAQYLDITIESGSGGGFGSCGAFVSAATIYTGTLATFTSTKTAFASGVGTWTPASPQTRVYKITYTLNAATPNSKQGTTTAATFQWESQA